MKTTSDTIRYARDLVRRGHTSEPAEVDAQGNIVKYCAATALVAAVFAAGERGFARRAWSYVGSQCGGMGLIPTFSREHSREEVVAMFDRAIVAAELDEKHA